METSILFSHAQRLDEVTEELERRHHDMLEAESGEEREEILRQLRGHITEFLYLASPRGKFKLRETPQVLYKSVQIDSFDPRDAKEAFEDLANYAHNLLEQPWRKEFRKISLVSGFFLHNIRAHLCDPQDLLVALGYASTDDHTMELHHVGDEELLRAFSRDCYVASHECLILSQIWEKVQREVPNNPMTLLEAWSTRQAYVGDVDSACSSLFVQARKRFYEREEAERELKKQKEHEEFQLILAKAQLAPPPEVPVDNTLVDLTQHEHNDDELARRVLENTQKESYATKTVIPNKTKSGLGGQPYLNPNAAQFHPVKSPPALNGFAYTSHFPATASDYATRPYDNVDEWKRDQEQAAELEEVIMQKFMNGDVPGGYRPARNVRTHKIHVQQQEENPYYSAVEGARPNEKQPKERDFAFQPFLDQSRERETGGAPKSENSTVKLLQVTNKTDEQEYSMLHDAQEMLGTLRGRVPSSKPIDCAPRQELVAVEPMDTSPPVSYQQRHERVSPANIPAVPSSSASSSTFKSLSRKQDLPKPASTESEKKSSPGEKLKQLIKGNKSPKGSKEKENTRAKKQLPESSTNSAGQIVLGDFPLDRTKLPNPDCTDSPNANTNANSPRKAFGDKQLDETDEMLRRLELEEDVSQAGANNKSLFDATISISEKSDNVQQQQGEWDCRFCTYKNTAPHKICVMCSKSRDCPDDFEPKPKLKLSASPPRPISASPPKKSSESVWKNVTGKKKSSKTGSGGSGSSSSKTPNESEWPTLTSDATTSAVYDTTGRRSASNATAEARSAYFSNKAKNQQTSVASKIAAADAAVSTVDVDPASKLPCPQCTYLNDPRKVSCEMCNSKL